MSKIWRTPRDVAEVFEIFGPHTPQGLYNKMIRHWEAGDKYGAMCLLEANLIMREYERRVRASAQVQTTEH